jgi:DNA-binding transcriptional MerR regulator
MDKSPDAFRTISEVAELLETPAHVLRFWESRFPQIKPVKRAGGRRYYRPADMALLAGIRQLLHDEGMTIRGVQKILREQGVRHVSGLTSDEALSGIVIAPDVDAPIQSSDPIPLFTTPGPPVVPDAVADIAALDAAESVTNADTCSDTPLSRSRDDGAAIDPAKQGDHTQATEAQADDLDPEELAALEAALSGPFGNSETVDDVISPAAEVVVQEPVTEPDETVAGSPLDVNQAPQTVTDLAALDGEAHRPAESGGHLGANSTPFTENLTENPTGETSVNLMADAQDADAAPADEPPVAAPAKAPTPMPIVPDITGHWLPADLRALRKGALADKHEAVEPLLMRLEALRNRVGDLGRVPRR